MLYRIHSVYSGNHLRRCPQRYRARIPHYDADPGSALRGHHSLFCYQTGSTERREVFPDPESCEFLLDDSRSCHGADVLLSVHCHGYSHHLRLLYEKRCFHRRLHQKCRDLRYRHCYHGRSDDHSRRVRILRWRSRYLTGRSFPDVHHTSQGLRQHGHGHLRRYPVLRTGTIRSHDQLHCTYRKCCVYFRGRAWLGS